MGNRKARDHSKRKAESDAWVEVQSTARDFADDVCLPGIGLRRLQLAVVPSFDSGYSWDVRSLNGVFRLFRSDVIDEPYYEPLRLRGYTELEASTPELCKFLNRLGSLTLPVAPPAEDSGGLDGTTYHLALSGNFGSEVRFRWWEEPPVNWQPLGELAGEMIARFMSLETKSGLH